LVQKYTIWQHWFSSALLFSRILLIENDAVSRIFEAAKNSSAAPLENRKKDLNMQRQSCLCRQAYFRTEIKTGDRCNDFLKICFAKNLSKNWRFLLEILLVFAKN
jgi:hypothetical protein